MGYVVLTRPNPYHRLVKGYKLLSDSKNDPVKDARLALDLLHDEVVALAAMQDDDPNWMSLLHFLLRGDAPLKELLSRGGAAPPVDSTPEDPG